MVNKDKEQMMCETEDKKKERKMIKTNRSEKDVCIKME